MTNDSTPKRDPKTGRFNSGHSGNFKGRPTKKTDEALPHDLALIVLKVGALIVDVTDQDGKPQHLPALEVMLRQLSIAGVKGDKAAARAFINHTVAATRVIEARMLQRSERLGAYLKSVDEGTPWRLDEAEAAFYQELADEAGIPITIKAHNVADDVAALASTDIDAIIANPSVWGALKNHSVGVYEKRELVRRIIYAHWRTSGRGR